MTWTDAAVQRLLQAEIALRRWDQRPSVAVDYDAEEDLLIIDFFGSEAVEEIERGQVLIEYAAVGGLCRPSRLYVAGARHRLDDDNRDIVTAIIGDYVFGIAMGATRSHGSGRVDFLFSAREAADLVDRWRHIPENLRPAQQLRLSIGVEILRDRIRAGVVGPDGEVLGGSDGVVERRLSRTWPEDVIGASADIVDELTGRIPESIGADVGLHLSAPVDSRRGTVLTYNKLHGPDQEEWDKVELGKAVAAATGRRTVVANDAEALAWRELLLGVRRDADRFALLLIGDGIGGRLVEGEDVRDFPMEVGILRSELGGRSVEERAAIPAVVARVGARSPVVRRDLAEVLRYAESGGDAVAHTLLGQAGQTLASVIAIVRATLRPEVVVICAPGELLGTAFTATTEESDEFLGWCDPKAPRIEWRSTSGSLGVEAAAALVRR